MNHKLDGKALSQHIQQEIIAKIDILKDKGARLPRLAVVLVGDDGASMTYVASKERTCHKVGIISESIRLSGTITQAELDKVIDDLNQDRTVDGILIQLPLPGHLDSNEAVQRVSSHKDVDGFHFQNVGRLHTHHPSFVPCTPKGIISLLDASSYAYEGQHAVVIGRSNLVGRPIAQLLLDKNMTVSIVHSRSKGIEHLVHQADLVVAAAGRPHFVKPSWISEGVVLIDVGIHRIDGKITGDIDPLCFPHASYYTPVPGGVGPMTIASLLENTMIAYQLAEGEITWE